MIASFLIFYITITLFAMTLLGGVYGVATRSNLIKKIIMLNVMGDAINMLFILIGYRLVYPVFPPIYEKHLTVEEFLSRAVDPVPQALVLTAVVIGMAMNILLATYAIQFYRLHGTIDARDMAEIMRGGSENEGKVLPPGDVPDSDRSLSVLHGFGQRVRFNNREHRRLIISLTVGHWLIENDAKFFSPRRWFYAVIYALRYFFIEETKTHIDVAKRVFTLKANPGIVRIPLEVENDYGKVLVANSITNTPGTVVVDISDDGKWLYVHWIDVSTLDEKEIKESVVAYFEDYAKKIFD